MSSVAVHDFSPETEINIHKTIRFHPNLSHAEKLFYAEIDSMSKNKHCPFSSRKMSEIFGVSHQTILNWVKKLIDLDLVEIRVDYKDKDCHQFITTKNKN
jgi:predicted transcriptional regulator